MLKRHFHSLIVSVLSASISCPQVGWAHALPSEAYSEAAEGTKANHVVLVPRDPTEDGIQRISVTYIHNAIPSDVIDVLKEIPNSVPKEELGNSHVSTDVVISTDSPEVLATVSTAIAEGKVLSGQVRPPKFLLYDKIFQSKPLKSVQSSIGRFFSHIRNAWRQDRVGVYFTTITTGVETLYWLSAESAPPEARLAQSAFSIMVALTLGLNKDLWTKLTRPGQQRVADLLESLGADRDGHFSQISSQFVSNLGLSVAFQAVRMSILSFDHLVQSLQSMNFWSTTVLLGTLLTVSGFAWADQLERIDQVTNPIAKTILRRACEVRNLIMAGLAPSAMITQPTVYGYGPWIILAANGALGLISLLNSERIVNWLEQSRIANHVHVGIKTIEEILDPNAVRKRAQCALKLLRRQPELQ